MCDDSLETASGQRGWRETTLRDDVLIDAGRVADARIEVGDISLARQAVAGPAPMGVDEVGHHGMGMGNGGAGSGTANAIANRYQ